jgi:hypothetical protein
MRKRPVRLRAREDATFLAGWMYADLFLAMMVVFLATVSFIPEYLGSLQQGATNSAYNYTQIYKKPMVVVYQGFNGDQIASDIRAFIADNKLSADSEIVYAQIVGAYNKNTETPADAILRAQQFSTKMDDSNITLLHHASTTFSSTASIAPDRVVVKFTFASNIGVKETP